MSLSKYGVLACAFAFSLNAFAVCDQEKRERDEFRQHADDASKAASAACAAGGITAIFTFGASLAPCVAAVPVADNQKRIFEEKERNLASCENSQLAAARRAAELAVERAHRTAAVVQQFSIRRDKVVHEHQDRVRQIKVELVEQGNDVESPELRPEIEERTREIQTQLDAALGALKIEQDRAVAGI